MRKHIVLGAIAALSLTSSAAFAQERAAQTATDHAGVVGHWAITWFAPVSLAIVPGTVKGSGASATETAAPPAEVRPVGVRYWLNSGMGVDVGVGFASQGGATETKDADGTVKSVDDPSRTAFVLHAGTPFAISTGQHYSLLIIPEANLGTGSTKFKATFPAPQGPLRTEDVTISAFRLDLGARAGAEIHFGFMNVPQLSLQATVGAAFAINTTSTSFGGIDTSTSRTSLATSVQNEPWALFTGNVAALYYF